MYSLSEAVRSDKPLGEIFTDAAVLVPTVWEYPELIRARIVFDGRQHVAPPFQPTDWKLSSDIVLAGDARGQLEVYYLQQPPDADDGPFSGEQRSFVDAVAGVLAQTAEKKLTEEALRLRSSIIDHAIEGAIAADLQGKIIFVNRQMAVMHGYEPEALIGKNISVFHTPEQMSGAESSGRQLTETGQFTGEIEHVRRDGGVFPAMTHVSQLRNDADEPIGLIGTCMDITDRKQAEDALRDSEKRHRQLVENLNEGIVAMDRDGVITFVNAALTRIVGESNEALLGNDFFASTNAFQREAFRRRLTAPPDEPPETFQVRFVRKDGKLAYLSFHGAPIIDDEGEHVGTLVVINDITERKQAERELLAERRRLRALAGKLSVAEDMERQRISVALHDNVSQELAAAKMKIGLAARSMSSTEHAESLNEVFQMIDRTLQDVTSLTFQLCPPMLYRQGLAAALKWLVAQFDSRHDESFEFVGQDISLPLTDEVRGFVFQSVRELLTNVVKHAGADRVTVTIRTGEDEMTITVADDGVGFDAAMVVRHEEEASGFGLFSIRQRIGHFGGRLDIGSQPARGSRVTVTVPLADEQES